MRWGTSGSNPKPRVVHVADCAAGVAAAIESYVAATDSFDHFIVHIDRGEDSSRAFDQVSSAKVFELQRSLLLEPVRLRALLKTLSPDVVHLHSSRAGAVGRVCMFRFEKSLRIVYSPHCFAFERLDLRSRSRSIVRFIERILSLNTTVVAACSERERTLARNLNRRMQVEMVPNVSRFSADPVEGGADGDAANSRPFTVVGLGRLSSQKDPSWFSAVVNKLRNNSTVRYEFVWIGSGPEKYQRELEACGVRVTGWLPEEDVQVILREGDIYMHTAAWEGYPVALLNAISAGLVPVVREIPAFAGHEELCVRSVMDAASRIQAIASDELVRQTVRDAWRQKVADNCIATQSYRLHRVYGVT